MPFTFNGTGTRYYGEREHDIGGTYITTKWIVVVGIPILPLSSWRVYPIGDNQYVDTSYFHGREASFGSQTYQATRVPLNWRQVRNVYLVTLGVSGTIIWWLHRSFPSLFT